MMEDQALIAAIREIQQASGGRYGSRRIRAALQQRGIVCAIRRVQRLMRAANLQPTRTKLRRRMTTVRHRTAQPAPNHLEMCFESDRPQSHWLGDITAIPVRSGWVYLASILDLHTRKIVGWAVDTRMDTALVLHALEMALVHEQPRPGVIHHTDQGSQYTATVYQRRVAQAGLTMSMSDVGNCYDNAPMESFWATLKTELTNHRRYESLDALRHDLFRYIEIFYNRQRLHSGLGYDPKGTPPVDDGARLSDESFSLGLGNHIV